MDNSKMVPICNVSYSDVRINTRYLSQLSDALDWTASQRIIAIFKEDPRPATVIKQSVFEFGLARVKNVLDRWDLWLLGIAPNYMYQLPYQPMEIPMGVTLDEEYVAKLSAELSVQAMERLIILENTMELELQHLGQFLADQQDAQKIASNAQRLGFYCGMIEYVRNWQGVFDADEGIEVMELELMDLLYQMDEPMGETYEMFGQKVSFVQEVGDALEDALNAHIDNVVVSIIQNENDEDEQEATL